LDKAPDEQSRKLIPRWRSIVRTPRWEQASSRKLRGVGLEGSSLLATSLEQWNFDGNTYSGIEALYTAVMFGRISEAASIANILLARGDLPTEVERYCREIVVGERPVPPFTDARRLAREAKRSLIEFPRNPVLRTQLALAYATQGQKKRAISQMSAALWLAPSNRTVVRSATRLLVHSGQQERALAMLTGLRDTGDPWILSALVATADLLGDRRAISPRKLRTVLDSGLPPFQLAELAASLATLEIEDGNIKRAKKMLAPHLEWMNENVAAQLRWLERHHRMSFDTDLTNVTGSFEATSLDQFARHNFEAAIASARLWHQDEPFAARASVHASYMASTYMQEYELALSFLEPAIRANPTNPTLHNNRAFALSELGRFDEARAALDTAFAHANKDEPDPVLLATKAHILIRSGQVLEGGFSYIDALELSRKQKKPDTSARIAIHLIKELIDLDYPFSQQEKELLDRRFAAATNIPDETRDLYRVLVSDRLVPREVTNEDDLLKLKLFERLPDRD
jgi:tetratricopeptide (TPR) repeat protein